MSLGDLNGGSCGGSSMVGSSSSYGWAVDDVGKKAVGTAYVDRDGDGFCEAGPREVVPFIWDQKKGMRELDTSKLPADLPWIRAHAISGNGEVVLGTSNFQFVYAWINEGKAIDLTARYGAESAYAASFDGHRVALTLRDPATFKGKGVALWNHSRGLTSIGSLKWCKDVPYVSFFGGDQCEILTPEEIEAFEGKPSVEVFDMNDDGSILIGRAGSFFTGLVGALWIEHVGWMTWDDFFRKQGVVEAANTPFSNPISISGTGREVVGAWRASPSRGSWTSIRCSCATRVDRCKPDFPTVCARGSQRAPSSGAANISELRSSDSSWPGEGPYVRVRPFSDR